MLVPVRDAQALADAVVALAHDDIRRQDMGRAGRELAESEFDIRKIAQRHLQLYNELSGSGVQGDGEPSKS